MTPDKLNEMASNMESLAESDHDLYIRERDELLEVARYLRQCAEVEPVATVRVHDTGGNAGIAWSGVPTENAGTMRGGTPLYTHPQPPSAQADAVEALLKIIAAYDDLSPNGNDPFGDRFNRYVSALEHARAVLAAQGGGR